MCILSDVERLTDVVSTGPFKAEPALELEETLQLPGKAQKFGDLLSMRKAICGAWHPFGSRLAFGLVAHVMLKDQAVSNRQEAIRRRNRPLLEAADASGVEWAHNLARVVESQQVALFETALVLDNLSVPEPKMEVEIVLLTEQFVCCLMMSEEIKLKLLSLLTCAWSEERRQLASERVRLGIERGWEYPPPPSRPIFVYEEPFGFSEEHREDAFFALTAEALPTRLRLALTA